MILTAVAILTNLDVNFDQFVAQHIPNVNLTASLECSRTVTSRLHEITGRQPKFAPANGSSACGGSATAVHHGGGRTRARRACSADAHGAARSLGAAPEFTETQDWFNTPGGRPADARLAARARGAGRLLDLHLHQLHPHAPLPEGLGRRLPQRRA